MRDVVVIGGGLTGLAAAYELEQQGIRYTLIEVKKRLGGSIQSVHQGGFVFDSGDMCHTLTDSAWFTDYLAQVGLDKTTIPLEDGTIAFRQGTGVLIDTLTSKLTAPIMRRMAVSTLGQIDSGRFSICMENGLVLDARTLLVAAPARYVERMLYTLTPEISLKLLDYPYETITRVSLGFAGDVRLSTEVPPNCPITFICRLSHPARSGTIIQAGLRFAPGSPPNDPKDELTALMSWHVVPDASYAAVWTESDPALWREPQQPQMIADILRLLPSGVALAGSDYVPANHPPRLDERIRQGIAAARRVMAGLV